MRGLVALYAIVCEEERTTSNSQLLQLFRKMDMAEEQLINASGDGDMISSSDSYVSLKGVGNYESATRWDEEEARKQSWAYLHAAFPTCLRIGSLANYLGDAGTAAVFRLLPHLRWVRRVDARGTGAGARAVAALCEVLYQKETVTLAISAEGAEEQSTVVLTLPAVPIEHVDLRDNAIFAMSARNLLHAVKTRLGLVAKARAELAAAVALTGPNAVVPRVDFPMPPAIHLDFDSIPPTTARALMAFHVDAVAAQQIRQTNAETEADILKRRLFCVDEGCIGTHGRPQPTGERVVYRVPESFPPLPLGGAEAESGDDPFAQFRQRRPDDDGFIAPFYDPTNDSAAALAHDVNTHMESYLLAYRCFVGRDAIAKEETLGNEREPASVQRETRDEECATLPSASARAAAQVCVDLGAETLAYMKDTQAIVWATLDIERRQGGGDVHIEGPVEKAPKTTPREKQEILYGVGRFLRGFLANPALEEELLAEATAMPLTKRHVERMRELYYAFTSDLPDSTVLPQVSSSSPSTDGCGRCDQGLDNNPLKGINELRGLYLRVVSRVVTSPFSATNLPSMATAEKRIMEVRRYLIDYLLEGQPLPTSARTSALEKEKVPLLEAKKSLPLLCTVIKYFKANHAEECAAWNACYIGGAAAGSEVSPEEAHHGATDEALAFYLRPFSHCNCAQTMAALLPAAAQAETQQTAETERRPCPACSHAALSELYRTLNSSYALQREALLAPLLLYLPAEVKHFLLSLALEQQRLAACEIGVGKAERWRGSGYVPAFFGLPSSLEAFTSFQQRVQEEAMPTPTASRTTAGKKLGSCAAPASAPFVSIVDYFAYIDGKRERLIEFCEAFAEWYRLKAVENFDCTRV